MTISMLLNPNKSCLRQKIPSRHPLARPLPFRLLNLATQRDCRCLKSCFSWARWYRFASYSFIHAEATATATATRTKKKAWRRQCIASLNIISITLDPIPPYLIPRYQKLALVYRECSNATKTASVSTCVCGRNCARPFHKLRLGR